jgi:hypothetical protein
MAYCLLEAALKYAELGYSVFPCVPGRKEPLTEHGHRDATTDAEQIERWWRQRPNANIGINTTGLLVLDRDVESIWLTDSPERLMELAVAPLSLTANSGRQYVFRQSAGKAWRNTAGKLAPKVDTRADGGYIVAPPSVLADGKDYAWAEGMALEEPPAKLPEPPAWLVAELDELANEAKTAIRVVSDGGNPIPSGQRNATLARLAGTMRRVGMPKAEILVALERANLDRCQPPLDRREVKRIATSVARYPPDEVAVALVENHFAQMYASEASSPLDPGPFPHSLLTVPGYIGRVIEHNLAGAIKPQPVLALASAIALVGVITGRKITDQYGTRTNVYCLGVCQSGGGKERARQVNKDILFRAGLEKMIGPEGIASHAGLISAVEKQPAILFQLDEIGRMLKTIGEPSRSPHLYHIATVLMKMFTSSATVYMGDAYADIKQNKKIYQPHVCLYGTTVPQSLYEGLTTESVTDGFLSRMLVFETNDHDPEAQEVVAQEVPEWIIEQTRMWGAFSPGGNLSGENPQPKVITYSAEAREAMVALEQRTREQRLECGEPVTTLWTRTTEKARKLALIYACSANAESPVVNEEAANWAATVSEYLTRKIIFISADWVSETPFEAKRKRVLREIRKAGHEGLTRTQLCRKTKHLQTKERTEIIQSLQATGEIKEERAKTGGAPKVTYRAC